MMKARNVRSRKMGVAQHSYQQQTLFSASGNSETKLGATPQECQVVSVGKRRDGGTRYWCLQHKADATAKYGKPARACRASHIPPIGEKDTLDLDVDKYKGGIALWGAVPAVYDTTRLPMDRGSMFTHASRQMRRKKWTARFVPYEF